MGIFKSKSLPVFIGTLLILFSASAYGEVLLSDRYIYDGLIVKDPDIKTEKTGKTHKVNGKICPVYRDIQTNKKTHELFFKNEDLGRQPKWKLSQWSSKANLYPHHAVRINKRAFGWENWFKTLILGRPGSGYRFVTMGVNGAREYKGKWGHKENICYETPHPHLFLEQSITKQRSLASLKEFWIEFSGRLTRDSITASREASWDKNKYTAHFKIHLNFQNIRKDKDVSKGHGQSFGVSIVIYDARNRNRDYKDKIWLHKPRQRIIRHLNVNDLDSNFRTRIHSGRWASFQKNILPQIRQTFSRAVQEGKINPAVQPLVSKKLSSYSLTAVNFGWEVSSLHSVEMQVSDFIIDVY